MSKSKPGPLFKTTLVIWSDFDASKVELERLAQEATSGKAYCSVSKTKKIKKPQKSKHWDGTEFFNK